MESTASSLIIDTLMTGIIKGVYVALNTFWYLWLSIAVLAIAKAVYSGKSKQFQIVKLVVLAMLVSYTFCISWLPYILRQYFAK